MSEGLFAHRGWDGITQTNRFFRDIRRLLTILLNTNYLKSPQFENIFKILNEHPRMDDASFCYFFQDQVGCTFGLCG